MPNPAVSVVIPTHNRAELLREALDSVAAQTFRDFEVIVVDDGSQPPLPDSIARHPVAPRVLRRERNRGPAAARNLGVAHAEAEVIAFLDSDDLWCPNKLERFVEELDRSDRRIFYGPMRPIDAQRQPVPGRTKTCYDGAITQRLFCSSFVHAPTVVCRREVLTRAGGFDETLPVCEDYDLWLRISVSERFGLVREPLAQRRLHATRLSKARMGRNLLVKARMLERFHQAQAASGVLDRGVARARLAKTYLAAGRACFREGRFDLAAACADASLRCGGSWLRTLPLRWTSRLARATCCPSHGPDVGNPAPALDPMADVTPDSETRPCGDRRSPAPQGRTSAGAAR